MLSQLLLVATLVGQAFTSPVDLLSTPYSALAPRDAGDINLFIALGESYASGVGAGVPDQSVLVSRCLRYNQAYPRVMANDSGVTGPASETRLINNACSGQKIPKILSTQFSDADGGGFHAFVNLSLPRLVQRETISNSKGWSSVVFMSFRQSLESVKTRSTDHKVSSTPLNLCHRFRTSLTQR